MDLQNRDEQINPNTTTEYALIGCCDICGKVTAVDLDGTPEHEREMQMEDRTVIRVTKNEAKEAWNTAGCCDHKAFIKQLREKR